MATAQSSVRHPSTTSQFKNAPSQSHDIGRDVLEYLKEYAREKPEVAAMWCFGIGFILGWKLKPW